MNFFELCRAEQKSAKLNLAAAYVCPTAQPTDNQDERRTPNLQQRFNFVESSIWRNGGCSASMTVLCRTAEAVGSSAVLRIKCGG